MRKCLLEFFQRHRFKGFEQVMPRSSGRRFLAEVDQFLEPDGEGNNGRHLKQPIPEAASGHPQEALVALIRMDRVSDGTRIIQLDDQEPLGQNKSVVFHEGSPSHVDRRVFLKTGTKSLEKKRDKPSLDDIGTGRKRFQHLPERPRNGRKMLGFVPGRGQQQNVP